MPTTIACHDIAASAAAPYRLKCDKFAAHIPAVVPHGAVYVDAKVEHLVLVSEEPIEVRPNAASDDPYQIQQATFASLVFELGSVVAEETGDLLATCASSDLRQITLNVRLSLRRSDHKGIQALRVALLTRDNCCCCDADALLPDEREFAAQGIAKVAPDTKQDRQYQLVWSLVRCDGRDDCDDCGGEEDVAWRTLSAELVEACEAVEVLPLAVH